MVLGTLAEHSIPFSKAPVIVELAQTLSLDKPALHGIKLSRTAASYKMIHGLGQTYSERTFSNMKRFPFLLNLDKSTSNNNKKKNNIPWKNLVSMLIGSCAVMRTNIVPTCSMLMGTPVIIYTMRQRSSQSPLTAIWRNCSVISRLTISGVQTR
ncbi:hypothetical protein DPEC_G00069750 [Dallia pectoralis]|uniref:Uncharacterized protein n=1 Tax=Dallia pectoralis TaxID=75939 RepID=A0ACC2H2J0_DALPE|nr:hypothetical protein DPEC_G00069750 [Dallia pectoralis]